MDNVEQLVKKLIEKKLGIAFMESASGFANAITNVEGASEILQFSAVTYSNEFKMKMGVPQEVIEKYTVYSRKTAREMARSISDFSHSSIGVGITGKLNRVDKYNLYGEDHVVFVAVYYQNTFYEFTYLAQEKKRNDNKEALISFVLQKILVLL